jgi:hypothetical protein
MASDRVTPPFFAGRTARGFLEGKLPSSRVVTPGGAAGTALQHPFQSGSRMAERGLQGAEWLVSQADLESNAIPVGRP